MAFYKRCHEKGCDKSGPRCKHPWYLELMIDGVRERGPVTKYAHLLPPRADGLPRKVTSADELRELESYVVIWVKQGRPGRPPTPGGGIGGGTPTPGGGTHKPEGDAGEPRTVADACDAYQKGHVAGMADKGAASIVRRIKREQGDEPIARLFDRRALRDFLADVEEESSAVNSNRHLSRWSHLLTWCCAEYQLKGDSPFFHKTQNPTGIRKQREGSGRKRELTPSEERALRKALAAFDDGGMMLARFDCALDCALRRGEMLALRCEDVIRDKGGVRFRIRWGTAKSRRERIVPVTSPRLLAWLKTRRWGFVFGQLDGSRLDSFRTDWDQILINAGIDDGKWEQRETAKGQRYGHWVRTVDGDLHWHDLRHEGATRLAAKGTPPHELQALLGHADLSTTQVYLTANVSSLAANMRRAQVGLR